MKANAQGQARRQIRERTDNFFIENRGVKKNKERRLSFEKIPKAKIRFFGEKKGARREKNVKYLCFTTKYSNFVRQKAGKLKIES